MLTTSKTSDSILSSFNEGCEAYVVKPIEKKKLFGEMEKLGLIQLQEDSRLDSHISGAM